MEQTQTNKLTEGKIFPTLMKFALPFLVANFLQLLYGAIDLLVVGQFCDKAAVSAVSTGSQVMKTITCLVTGLATGATVLIGQYIGAKRRDEAAKTVGSTVVLFVIVAVILTAIMLCFTRQIAFLMQAPEEAFEQTVQYVFICSAGILFIVGYNAVSCILRGMGDSTSPMIFVIVASVINVGLDLLFVAGLNMAADGAAYATIAAQACSFAFALVYLKVRGFGLDVKRGYVKLDKKKTKGILRFGSPVALQDSLVNISFLIITSILNSKGLTASAAVGVVEKVICFAMLPPSALSAAIAAMTAQNVGAARPDRAKTCVLFGIAFTVAIETAVVLFSELGGGKLLLAIFSNDAEVIDAGFVYMRSYVIDCMLVCFVFCLNGFFNGCGKTLFTMCHSLVATFAIRVPFAFLMSVLPGTGLFEIGLAAPVASVFSIAACLIYLATGRWKNYSVDKSVVITEK